ncbi:MAG: radical SAM protein [Candidatus Bathyarchaeota archaeon]|nr:MAG: radical SAM protein [Candidatus Bathyarchaeota archaeon]
MIVNEISAKTVLSKSRVFDYAVNPYVGCEHKCTYCYARFIKRFTGHKEAWGDFVDVKINAPELLEREIQRKKVGRVWVSGVCDPYQPLEKRYGLTKQCLKILSTFQWPVTIQTKSPLVLRDLPLLKTFNDIEVGFTVTTSEERIRRIFEPCTPPIEERIRTLGELKYHNIRTFAMIAPMLPEPEPLVLRLKGKVDRVLIDRMNYHYADSQYKLYGLQHALTEVFFSEKKNTLSHAFSRENVPFQFLY